MQLLQQLPRAWRLMLLTFDSAVSVYQLGRTGLVTADVVSGEWQPAMSSRKQQQQQQQQHGALHIHSPEHLHVASLQSCQGVAENVIDSWRCVCLLCCMCHSSTCSCVGRIMAALSGVSVYCAARVTLLHVLVLANLCQH